MKVIHNYGRFLLVFILIFALGASSCFATDDSELPVENNTDTQVQVLRVSANDTSGFHSVILSLIGDYNPVVKDYTYTSNNGYTSHSIDIQPDWSWIASAVIFIVVFYCFMRLVGMLLKGGN